MLTTIYLLLVMLLVCVVGVAMVFTIGLATHLFTQIQTDRLKLKTAARMAASAARQSTPDPSTRGNASDDPWKSFGTSRKQ